MNIPNQLINNNTTKKRTTVLLISVASLVSWCLSDKREFVAMSSSESSAASVNESLAWQKFSARLIEIQAADRQKEAQKLKQEEEELKKSLYSLNVNCNSSPIRISIPRVQKDIRDLTDSVASTVDTNKLYRTAVTSLVQVESQFDQDAHSDTGAIGLMQLTTSVCQDMLHPTRRDRYMDIFRSVYEKASNKNIFSSHIWVALELWTRGETPWENYIQFLWDHRRDPSVNLLIGNVYYRSLWKEYPDKDTVRVAIQAAKRYNGSDRVLESGRPEQEVHAERFAAILRSNI